MRGTVTRRRLYLVLLAGWVLFILTLTSIPDPDFVPPFPGSDKVGHFGFYGVAGFLCALWRREAGWGFGASALCGMVFVALLGAADEVHQQWIPGRSMELLDWVADFTGGTAGALFSAAAVSLCPFLISRENQPAPRAVAD